MANSDDTQKLMEIIKDVADNLKLDESFFVVDLSDVLKKFDYWKAKLSRVQPFYAVKTNNAEPLLRLLSHIGVGFECSNKNEIEQVLALGASPSQVIFTHTFKIPSHLKYAKENGIDVLTFDSEEELFNIHSYFPTARLVLRFKVPDVKASVTFDEKFGCDISDSFRLLQRAKSLSLSVIGTSFHVGALCQDATAYSRAIGMAKEIFNVAKNAGYKLLLLDLGAGFSGHLQCYEEFDQVCDHINKALEEHFPLNEGIKIIAEPGTYFSGSAFTLCAYIFGKKGVHPESAKVRENTEYFIYDGLYGSFNRKFKNYKVEAKALLTPTQLQGRPVLRSKLWGYTSTQYDCIMENCILPDMNMGEFIVFTNIGAYSITSSCHFNGFPKLFMQYIFSDKKGKANWSESEINEIISCLKVEVKRYDRKYID